MRASVKHSLLPDSRIRTAIEVTNILDEARVEAEAAVPSESHRCIPDVPMWSALFRLNEERAVQQAGGEEGR